MLRRWVLRAWVFLVLVILLSPAVWAKTDPVRSARRLGLDRPKSFSGFAFARHLGHDIPNFFARRLAPDRTEFRSCLHPQLVFGLYKGRVVIATSPHIDVVDLNVVDETSFCANNSSSGENAILVTRGEL